jgi:hypothetical protein
MTKTQEGAREAQRLATERPPLGIGTRDVTYVDRTSDEDASRHATVSAHRGVAARPDGSFHPRTWVARTHHFEQRTANLQLGILQSEQIDARDHEVASQGDRIHAIDTGQPGNHGQVLGLDQRDLACGQIRFTSHAQPVVHKADAGQGHRASNGTCRISRATSHDDGLDPALYLRWPVEVAYGLHERAVVVAAKASGSSIG